MSPSSTCTGKRASPGEAPGPRRRCRHARAASPPRARGTRAHAGPAAGAAPAPQRPPAGLRRALDRALLVGCAWIRASCRPARPGGTRPARSAAAVGRSTPRPVRFDRPRRAAAVRRPRASRAILTPPSFKPLASFCVRTPFELFCEHHLNQTASFGKKRPERGGEDV